MIKEDIRFINWNLLNIFKIEAIYHLAGISNDPGNGVSDDLGLDINLQSSIRLYNSIKNTAVKIFIYPSSCSVYGKTNLKTVDESSSINPITNYAFAKAKFEEYISHNINKNISTIIIRPATVYGPSSRLRLDLLVNKILIHGMSNKSLIVPGLNNYRPQLYIKDLITIYHFFLNENKKGLHLYNAAFDNMKISEIINKVSKITSSKLDITSKTYVDQRSYFIDSTKIIKKIPNIAKSDITINLLDTMTFLTNKKIISNMDEDIYYNKKIQEKKWANENDIE